jgi:hypothetical protein
MGWDSTRVFAAIIQETTVSANALSRLTFFVTIYENSAPTSQKTHYISITKTNPLTVAVTASIHVIPVHIYFY